MAVATILASDLAHHQRDVSLRNRLSLVTPTGDNTTRLSLVDTSPQSDVTGFAVDSIQINDWVAPSTCACNCSGDYSHLIEIGGQRVKALSSTPDRRVAGSLSMHEEPAFLL